jgi:arylsulfatase
MPKEFKGVITLDIRDSTPDWDAFLPDPAPDGAPNVLVVAYIDVEKHLAAAMARD